MDKTALGDRMKRYEEATHQILPPRSYAILRVDMRAGHSYLKNADKPFDRSFIDAMNLVAEDLCGEIQGAQFAFTQSDETSVLYTDFANLATQPWFGGVVAKQISIAASVASASMMRSNKYWAMGLPTFDARVFTLPDSVEVANYFLWRQLDARRNFVGMVARHYMSHKECHGKSTADLRVELEEQHDIDVLMYPADVKNGRVTDYQRMWVTSAAPPFRAEPQNWLARNIPTKPSFG